jgi:hypothetical protein
MPDVPGDRIRTRTDKSAFSLFAPESAGDGPCTEDFADRWFSLFGDLFISEGRWQTIRIGGINKFLESLSV